MRVGNDVDAAATHRANVEPPHGSTNESEPLPRMSLSSSAPPIVR
jgi:hypothetical protein